MDKTEIKEDSFTIYQLKEEYMRELGFERLEHVRRAGKEVLFNNYNEIYKSPYNGEDLEYIFERFNIARPDDFKGHSLSVSDMIVLHRNGEDKAFYVDSFGFEEIPGFIPEHEKEQNMTEEITEAAYKMRDRYIGIKKEETGLSYSIYDEEFNKLHSGIYTGEDGSIQKLLQMLVEELKKPGYDERSDLFFRGEIQKNIMQNDEPEHISIGFLMERSDELHHTHEADPLYAARNAINSYREKTAELYNPESIGYSTDIIEETTKDQIKEIISTYDLDASIEEVMVFGSRSRGMEKKDDDLDIMVFYTGKENKENFQNLIKAENRILGGVKVDIKIFDLNGSETAEEYIRRAESYLAVQKSMKQEHPEEVTGIDPVMASIEELEEENSNSIDGIPNNGFGEKRKKEEEKKSHEEHVKDKEPKFRVILDPDNRRSVLERLKEKKEIVEKGKKGDDGEPSHSADDPQRE